MQTERERGREDSHLRLIFFSSREREREREGGRTLT